MRALRAEKRVLGSERWESKRWEASAGMQALGCKHWEASAGKRALGSEHWEASAGNHIHLSLAEVWLKLEFNSQLISSNTLLNYRVKLNGEMPSRNTLPTAMVSF